MGRKLLLLILAFSMFTVGCGAKEPIDEVSEQEKMVESIENAMYEVLGDDLKKVSKHELVATMHYGHEDGSGYGINYRIIKSTYYEADTEEISGFNKDAVGVLFSPDSADSYEDLTIQEWPAARYRVGDLSYLCFTYSPEVTYVLEYKADEIEDAEIMKIAESAEQYE